jgi:glycosyltransferase involved in cell wall biosynthesis
MPQGEVKRVVADALYRINPAVVAIPGWEDRLALAALEWAVRAIRPVVVMSDSNEFDAPRSALKERIKCRIVAMCDAGLVAGTTAAGYLEQLGMDRERIFLGYDVVDNGYFAQSTQVVRKRKQDVRTQYGLPERYFLASARFVEKKNLPRLVEAYARYRDSCRACQDSCAIWDLVLLGDGSLRQEIETQIADPRIQGSVHLPGFRQYGDLPAYYGLASCFIQASTVEQWGLVVNEAMASGLPVLISNRCGSAPDLVQEGVNGFVFDPLDVERLATLMFHVAAMPEQRLAEMGHASRQYVAEWTPETFATNLWKAVTVAGRTPAHTVALRDRVLLSALQTGLGFREYLGSWSWERCWGT